MSKSIHDTRRSERELLKADYANRERYEAVLKVVAEKQDCCVHRAPAGGGSPVVPRMRGDGIQPAVLRRVAGRAWSLGEHIISGRKGGEAQPIVLARSPLRSLRKLL
jgi:hypothetical protein